ncbi:hypothetical protein [Nocardioides houyundeii]|uniref:hypothetical protein n=1 Tax=Nocardioides houyundeii TaxID=2045452 RepID=UPI001F531AAC|nr:hypothetical protein [Nocardioides houyundeii]
MDSVSSSMRWVKNCFERSASQLTAVSRIGIPQVSPLSPSTRVIAQPNLAKASGLVPSLTVKDLAVAIASR